MDAQHERRVARVLAWYPAHARDLPWRGPDATAWGILVSEVMLQQTPVTRVLPAWERWMRRWPTPGALAAADTAELLRAWDRLGYPRRALRLQAAAREIRDRYDGIVPADPAALLALPGVGEYTAAAVASFAYGRRALVLDTNVRRVVARVDAGTQFPAAALTRTERERAAAYLPATGRRAARWNVAAMELGALVCTAGAPRCGECPLRRDCAWLAAGRPASPEPRRRQAWDGTDRQCRGRIMAALRDAPLPEGAALRLGRDAAQVARCIAGLAADGLLERHGDLLRLPGQPGIGNI